MNKINKEGRNCGYNVAKKIICNFKTVANDYKAKDTVDVKINDDLADVVNGFFREAISDEKYSEIMKSIARPENCTCDCLCGLSL